MLKEKLSKWKFKLLQAILNFDYKDKKIIDLTSSVWFIGIEGERLLLISGWREWVNSDFRVISGCCRPDELKCLKFFTFEQLKF